MRWVRPLHSIVCTFGTDIEEVEVIRFEVDGITSSNVTYGHRFLAPGAIEVRRLDDWMAKLEAAKVVADRDRRKSIILADAKDLALVHGLDLVEDEGLLDEVAGLVEWPVVLMGSFDAAFLGYSRRGDPRHHPRQPEVLRAEGPQDRAPRQPLHPDLQSRSPPTRAPPSWPATSRVIRARLSDAKFFWDTDRRTALEDRLSKFRPDHLPREAGLARASASPASSRLAAEIAPQGRRAGPALAAQQAARIAKADLLTEVVGEFPELQGLMGRYYAEHEKLPAEIAAACEDHYKPQGPSDRVPTAPVSIAVALADKIDTLVGFWAIDEKPTGSKDPYALRRAALGVIRIILDNDLRLAAAPAAGGCRPRQVLGDAHYRMPIPHGRVPHLEKLADKVVSGPDPA